LVLRIATLPLGFIAGKQNGDGVKIRACKSAYPVVRMIGASVTEDFRSCGHALLELLRERGERCFVHA
jgi:hypothetical protein